jgi:hypothetical protein
MTVVAVSMVRDEEDIVGATVAHMRSQVDHVIVADNLSTDRTRASSTRSTSRCSTTSTPPTGSPRR